jgi:hypothetical protein
MLLDKPKNCRRNFGLLRPQAVSGVRINGRLLDLHHSPPSSEAHVYICKFEAAWAVA